MESTNLFILINFCIGFFSDIALNILTKKNVEYLSSLKPYFSNKSALRAAVYAGITVAVIVFVISKIFKETYKYYGEPNKELPATYEEYQIFIIITFLIGYLADIIIYKVNIFPKLKQYYNDIGYGLWGGLAIVFSVVVSFVLLYLYREYNDLQIIQGDGNQRCEDSLI